jgi:hypothetical protein
MLAACFTRCEKRLRFVLAAEEHFVVNASRTKKGSWPALLAFARWRVHPLRSLRIFIDSVSFFLELPR